MLVNVICGPPGAGKTTYVKKHMTRGDLVVDLDYIMQAISLQPLHDYPDELFHLALGLKSLLIDSLGSKKFQAVWIITSLAKERHELKLAGGDQDEVEVVVLEVPTRTCIERMRKDGRSEDLIEAATRGCEKFWKQYSRHPDDQIICEIEGVGL